MVRNQKFEEYSSKAKEKIECSHETDLSLEEKNIFFFCSCSLNEMLLICKSCQEHCHKDHIKITQVSHEYLNNLKDKEVICECGKNSHDLNIKKKVEILPKCIFQDIIPDYPLIKDNESFLCAFCDVLCKNNAKLNESNQDACACNLHRSISEEDKDININIFHYTIRNIPDNSKILPINMDNINKSEKLKKNLIEKFKSLIKKYIDEKHKFGFYKENGILEILEIFDYFMYQGKKKYVYFNNLLNDFDIVKLLEFIKTEYQVDETRIKDDSLRYSKFFKIKVYLCNLIFVSFVKLFYLENNLALDMRSFIQMNFYQRKLYFYDSINFFKYNNNSENREKDLEKLKNFCASVVEIFSNEYKKKKQEEVDPKILLRISKPIKFFIKYNLIEDKLKITSFELFKNSILSLEKIQNTAEVSNLCFQIGKSILYYLYTLNDQSIFSSDSRNKKNYAYISGQVQNLISVVFILTLRKNRNEENPEFGSITKYILNLLLGDNFYYLASLSNLKYSSYLTLEMDNLNKFTMMNMSRDRFTQINNNINELSYYIGKLNKSLYDQTIDFETYIKDVNYIMRKSRIDMKKNVKLPRLIDPHINLGFEIDDDQMEIIHIFQYFIKFSNLTSKIDEMINTIERRKILHNISYKSKESVEKFMINGKNKRYLLSLLYLTIQRNPENVVLIFSIDAFKFADFFYENTDNTFLLSFIEIIFTIVFLEKGSYEYIHCIFPCNLFKQIFKKINVETKSQNLNEDIKLLSKFFNLLSKAIKRINVYRASIIEIQKDLLDTFKKFFDKNIYEIRKMLIDGFVYFDSQNTLTNDEENEPICIDFVKNYLTMIQQTSSYSDIETEYENIGMTSLVEELLNFSLKNIELKAEYLLFYFMKNFKYRTFVIDNNENIKDLYRDLISNTNKPKIIKICNDSTKIKKLYKDFFREVFEGKRYKSMYKDVLAIHDILKKRYLFYYLFEIIMQITFSLVSSYDKFRLSLEGNDIKDVLTLIKNFYEFTIYFYNLEKDNNDSFIQDKEKDRIFCNTFIYEIRFKINLLKNQNDKKSDTPKIGKIVEDIYDKIEENWKILNNKHYYEYNEYMPLFQNLINDLVYNNIQEVDDEIHEFSKNRFININKDVYNSYEDVLQIPDVFSIKRKKQDNYEMIIKLIKEYKEEVKEKSKYKLAFVESLGFCTSLEYDFDLRTDVFNYLKQKVIGLHNKKKDHDQSTSKKKHLIIKSKHIFEIYPLLTRGEYLIYLDQLINCNCKDMQHFIKDIKLEQKNFFVYLIYQFICKLFVNEISKSHNLYSQNNTCNLITSAFKIIQNFCEGHNETFQKLMFELNLYEEQNAKNDKEKSKNNNQEIKNHQESKNYKDSSTNFLLNMLRVIHDNVDRTLIFNKENMCKIFDSCIDLTVEMIQGTSYSNILYFYNTVDEEKTGPKAENLQNEKNNLIKDQNQINIDNQVSFRYEKNFIIVNLLNEVKQKFLGKETNELYLHIQTKIFIFLNNLINHRPREQHDTKGLTFDKFYKKLLEIFEPENMLKNISVFLKKVYLDYNEEIKNVQDFHFDEVNLKKFEDLYKKNQEIFNDVYFGLAAQMFRFLRIIYDKHPSNCELNKVISYKSKDFLKSEKETDKNDIPTKSTKVFPLNDNKDQNSSSKNSVENILNDYIATVKFFADFIKEIEFSFGENHLKKIFFLIEPRVYNIPISSIKKFMEEVPRNTPATKLIALIESIDIFYTELEYVSQIEKVDKNEESLKQFLYEINYNLSDALNFFIALILNFLLLKNLTSDILEKSNLLNQILFFCYIQIFNNFLFIFAFLYSRYNLSVNILRYNLQEENEDSSGFDKIKASLISFKIYILDSFLFDPNICLMIINTIFAFGIILNPERLYICILQLFTIYKFIPTIRDLIVSFKLSMTQVLSMIIFLLILMFIYANIGFFYFSDNFIVTTDEGIQENICQTLLQCFITYFDIGVKSSGGIADIMKPISLDNTALYVARLFNDMIFYIIVAILLIYMINGIIIGSFKELRDEHQKKEDDIQNKCFICSIDKLEFEKNKQDFKNHIRREHNLYDYIYYLVLLKFTDEKEMDNEQTTVAFKVNRKDIDIFPVGKCSHFITQLTEEENENQS